MALSIRSSSFVETVTLKIESAGVVYSSGALFTNRRHFRFDQIVCILLSEDGTSLSFQIGEEVFTLRVKPGNKKQEKVISAFVAGAVGTTR